LDLKIKDILRYAEEPVLVMHATTDGRYRGSSVARSQAFSFFESGMALYFNLSSSFEDSREWTNALASDLGQLQSRCKASLFITPANWTTEQHFDPNENFTIQLRGNKRWNIAPNNSVSHPVDRFTSSDVVPPRMSAYCIYKNLSPPEVCSSEEMGPGSMLYIPRGHWHSVESLTESISLNLCIVPETWVSLLVPLIERLLLTSPELREVATGVAGSVPLRRIASDKLKNILPIVSRLVADMRPQQIFPEINGTAPTRPPDPDDTILRNRFATVACDPANGKGSKVTITVYNFLGSTPSFAPGSSQGNVAGSATSKTVFVTQEQLALLEWIFERGACTLRTIKSHFSDLSSSDVDDFVLSLIGAGLLNVDAE
jgi:hypothetical protein